MGPSLGGDDPASDLGLDTLVLDLHTLGLSELLEELFLACLQLSKQVVHVARVALVETLQLATEDVELIGFLEGSLQEIHGHVQVKLSMNRG